MAVSINRILLAAVVMFCIVQSIDAYIKRQGSLYYGFTEPKIDANEAGKSIHTKAFVGVGIPSPFSDVNAKAEARRIKADVRRAARHLGD